MWELTYQLIINTRYSTVTGFTDVSSLILLIISFVDARFCLMIFHREENRVLDTLMISPLADEKKRNSGNNFMRSY